MQVQPARWGVLVYSSASPDIEPACRASFDAVVRACPQDGVAVAAQLGTAASVRRASSSGIDETRPAQDMSQTATLEDFLRWGMEAVPAERYLVVLGGHGSGFMGAVTDPTRQHIMRPQEMRGAFAAVGMHADVVVLNACLEANAEVALELAPQTDYLVASQGLQHAEGIPLGDVIERLRAQTRPSEAARLVVEAARALPQRTPLLSAIDEHRLAALIGRLDALGQALLDDPDALSAARGHIAAMRSFREDQPWDRPLVDLKDIGAFARAIATDPKLAGSPAAGAADALAQASSAAVVASVGPPDRDDAGGISLYLPSAPLQIERARTQYDSLALAGALRWHAAVRQLESSSGRTVAAPPRNA